MNFYMKKYVTTAYALKNAKLFRNEQAAKLRSMYTGQKLANELHSLDETVILANVNYVEATKALKKAVEKVIEASVPRLFIGDCREMLDILKTGLVRTSSELLAMADANEENMLFLRAAYEYSKEKKWDEAGLKLLTMQEALFIDSRYAKEMLSELEGMFENPDHINAYEHANIIAVYDENLTKLLNAYPTVEHANAMKAEEEELQKEKARLAQAQKDYEQQKAMFDEIAKAYEDQKERLEKTAAALENQQEGNAV